MPTHQRRTGDKRQGDPSQLHSPMSQNISSLPEIGQEPANSAPQDETKKNFSRKWIIRYILLKSIGNFLIFFALFGVGVTLGPALYYEVLFQIDQHFGIHYTVESTTSTPSQLGKITSTNERIITPPDTLFSVVIPKINAAARVIPNVDPSNETEYLAALKLGIAHAKGTVFPGMPGTSFFFAHSTDNFWDVGRYNAVFYLLKDMTVGDDIVIFFNNYRYNYKVTKTEILDPSDVTLLINAQKNKTEQVVLQTCWPPGTTWKRFIVIAKPVKK